MVLAIVFTVWGLIDVRARGRFDPADPGEHRTDLTVYTEAGAAFFDGRPPYEVTNPRGWRYLYPPLFAMLLAPLHVLPAEAQVLVWFVVSALAAWGCYSECVRLARSALPGWPEGDPFGRIPPWIAWCAAAAVIVPIFNCLQRGQVSVPKLYLLLLGVRLLIESRSAARAALAGAVLALPIVLKVTPLVPVAIVLFQQLVVACAAGDRRSIARAGATWLGTAGGLALAVLVIPAMLVGWRANLGHLETWVRLAMRVETSTGDELAGDNYSARNQSFPNAVRRAGNWASYEFAGGVNDEGAPELGPGGAGLLMDNAVVGALLLAGRVAAGLAALAVGYRAARGGDTLAQLAAFGLACAATLVVFSLARGSYFVMLLPAVVFVAAWLARKAPPLGRLCRPRTRGAGPRPLCVVRAGRPDGPVGPRHDRLVCMSDRRDVALRPPRGGRRTAARRIGAAVR